MKVLLIDVNYKYSSTGKIVHDLYQSLTQDGHEAAVCYGRGPKITEHNVFKFGLDIETYFHALMTRITGWTGYFSFFSTKRLLKFIDEFNPDVVHIHELHAYFVNIKPVIEYLKGKNIKIVLTLHCEFMYTGKCGYANDCEKWKTICFKCPQLHAYPASWIFDYTRKMYKEKKALFQDYENLIVVTPSKWLLERVNQSFLQKHPNLVVHNGIDTNQVFYPRDTNALKTEYCINDEKIVLAVAPDLMNERKGGAWVLKLADRMKSYRIKFLMVGVDDKELQHGDNVILIGRISDQNILAQYYSLADVFLICSKKENFPTTCLEALACGTPVVGFDTGGTKETTPDEYGAFCEYGDIQALQKNVENFLFKVEKQSLKCREFAMENYSPSAMYCNYKEKY
ncbi:glycosyltransferase [Sphaerochaeta sp. PS]|uniref:glycosyltransferase n=1 Tax=Sphaerochaeta sp. PS TaxID=3076336 RepID=UPI0028A32AF8|nr:glycosyltransferase [Sphaerochaeta sp. PS]MDT4763372.1 glycosyltransferase [Sphaerochaeta sp. PS]